MKRGTPVSASLGIADIDSLFGKADEIEIGLAPVAKAPVSTNDPAPIKLNSATGRVIHVNTERGIDAARAFRMLGMRLAQNNVRKDAQRQRFHERPGLKRKRLKSERWRKRFKEAFQGTVARVVNMKRQGW
jgi:ribosomal protein S21